MRTIKSLFLNNNKDNNNTNYNVIIEVTCPFDTRILEAETEKISRYQDLKYELERIWNCKEVRVIPIVIGSLGTISWLTQVSETIHFGTLQKACLLGTSTSTYIRGV